MLTSVVQRSGTSAALLSSHPGACYRFCLKPFSTGFETAIDSCTCPAFGVRTLWVSPVFFHGTMFNYKYTNFSVLCSYIR